MVLGGFGWFLGGLTGFRWFWVVSVVSVTFGWFWLVLAGFWVVLGGFEWFWVVLGGLAGFEWFPVLVITDNTNR